jgi:hypothetical protein
MSRFFIGLFVFSFCRINAQTTAKVENVILVTFDGYRWREVFDGAQKKELNCAKYNHGKCEVLTQQFWDKDPKIRREKLMPFFWNTIARQGQLYGNRLLGSRVGVSNIYQFSYPGYNEIFTGQPSLKINSNDYGMNPNSNIFDSLSAHGFKGKMAGFATWDAFTRIINNQRTGVPVFAGIKPDSKGVVNTQGFNIDHWETTVPPHNDGVQLDSFTYHEAKEYLHRYHPRFAYIGFDETDEDAHEGHYENYLNAANTLDRYMQDLWTFIQSDPHYKDKTAIIITCDHGRGDKVLAFWQIHHTFIPHSKFTWIAAIGPGIAPKGEIKGGLHIKQKQIAATIGKLLGYSYKKGRATGKPIKGIVEN